MSASSEFISVKVRREACSHTSSARASTLRVPCGLSSDGRRDDDRLLTTYDMLKYLLSAEVR